jgi:hypothetical protein
VSTKRETNWRKPMQVVTYSEIECRICKLEKKWGVRFHFDEDSILRAERTAPWFNEKYIGADNYCQCFVDGCGLLLFDTEAEAMEIFKQTIMDEIEKDETPVYACVIDPYGLVTTENT